MPYEGAYSQLYSIGFAEAGLQIGHSAFLWNLFVKPRLLYGAEVWSVDSPSAMKQLEDIQVRGARRIFGKSAQASIIDEALRGDLGWLSVQSQIAKLRFYGHLCRLPTSRLLKQVFLYRMWQHDTTSTILNTLNVLDKSWVFEIKSIFESIGLRAADYDPELVASLSPQLWNQKVEKLVKEIDSELLFLSFSRTASGSFPNSSKNLDKKLTFGSTIADQIF